MPQKKLPPPIRFRVYTLTSSTPPQGGSEFPLFLGRNDLQWGSGSNEVFLQAVRRNIERFPADFMFQLTKPEYDDLRSQIVISSWGGRRYPPYAFTEQGVAMLSSVLRSERAIRVNIEIMRAFLELRRMQASHADLARKLSALEKKYDKQFNVVFEAIRGLMAPPELEKKGRIGFSPSSGKRK